LCLVKITKQLRLRDARKRAGLTQEQLEAKSGVEQTAISSLETGKIREPRWSTARKLESALGLAHGTLIFGDEAAR
jgi:transcriptional regulator with XRE-family HTH domain